MIVALGAGRDVDGPALKALVPRRRQAERPFIRQYWTVQSILEYHTV